MMLSIGDSPPLTVSNMKPSIPITMENVPAYNICNQRQIDMICFNKNLYTPETIAYLHFFENSLCNMFCFKQSSCFTNFM